MPLELDGGEDGDARALLTCLGTHGIVIDDTRLARLAEGLGHLRKLLAVSAPSEAGIPAERVGAATTLSATPIQPAAHTVLPILSLSLSDAASQIRSGQLSPVTLLEACLQRIALLDDEIHAFTTLDIEGARHAARRAADDIAKGLWRGPLHGVPISIKDVIDVAGLPTLAQSRHRRQAPLPATHAAAVSQLVRAGAVLIGKTTTHEYAFGGPEWTLPAAALQQQAHQEISAASCASIASDAAHASASLSDAGRLPGPAARNPWSTARFAGGSSSGAAASVACGMALGALGSDTAGSIRSPAALCGMTGFKPGRHTIERSGCLPLTDSLDAMGVIAESAMDCALLFDALNADPSTSLAANLSGALQGLKIGVIRHFFTDGLPISTAATQYIDAAIAVFEDAGAIVEAVDCASLQAWNAVGMTILLAEAFALYAPALRDHLDAFGDTFADAVLLGAALDADAYQRATAQRAALTASMDALAKDYDLLVAPIQAGEAPYLTDLSPWGFLQRPSYGIPFNLADMPALSLCCGFGPNGLPLALQLVCARGNEAQVLDAAHGFQMRTDWHLRHRQPPPYASTAASRSAPRSAPHSQ